MHAYRDVGGRAASGIAAEVVEPRLPAAGRSGTKAEESSGLYNTFPPGGNGSMVSLQALPAQSA